LLPSDPKTVATAAKPAHDIQLQVSRGDQRVDVRMVERAGEVHVAVRTQDTRLAGALQQDLPALSARLEQTGFRTDTWHPPSTAEAQVLAPEASPFNSSHQYNESQQHSGQQQDQRPPHRPETPGDEENNEHQKKEFLWLISQLH
jgi:hypothetical protein